MNAKLLLIIAAVAIAFSVVGVSATERTPTGGQSDFSQEAFVGPTEATGLSPHGSPSAQLNISLKWVNRPSGVDSTGTLSIVVRANRTITDETLHIDVPDGVDFVKGQRSKGLSLQRGESIAMRVRVAPKRGGLHRIHVYSSNLVAEENGTLRASEVIGLAPSGEGTEESGNGSAREATKSVEPPSDASKLKTTTAESEVLAADSSSTAANSVSINGYFSFERDNDPYGSGEEGSWGSRVEVWDADPISDDKLATVYVSEYGFFDVQVDIQSEESDGELELYLKAFAENGDVARVEDTDNTVHWWRWPASGTVSKSGGETWSPSFKATGGEPWLHILRNLMEGWTYVHDETGYEVPKETVEWDAGSTHGSHHHPSGEIHLEGVDGWDDDVILHEYGHHVMDERYGYTPGDPETHNMWTNTDLDTAWVEGWPTYFEASVQNEPNYEDINNGVQVFDWSLEDGGQCSGVTCEGAVIKALWDIEDSTADSRYGSPHDQTVELDDDQDVTFADTWTAFASYKDSETISNGGTNVDTINEFRTNWYEWNGYENEDVMIELFALNRLPYNSSWSYNDDPTAWYILSTNDPNVGAPVLYDGTYSSDGENGLESWEWDANGDGIVDDTGTNGVYNYSTHGTYTVEMTLTDNVGATDTVSSTFDIAPAPVCSSCAVPNDPDNDGVYEDVNGDGSVTFLDAYRLYQETLEANQSEAFDVNGDGSVTFLDAYRLYQETI